MTWRLKYEKGVAPYLIPARIGTSTGLANFVGSSDIGKLMVQTTDCASLAVGTTADRAKAIGILGIVAAVPAASTPGSTELVYIQPVTQYDVVEATYSTSVAKSTSILLATSNIGYFFGISNTTTIAGAATLDVTVAGTAAGTTDGLFFKLLGYSTKEYKAWGLINSSHLALS